MLALADNDFPLRFRLEKQARRSLGGGPFFMSTVPGEFDGQDSCEEVFKSQEENSFAKVPQVTTENPVKEICHRDCQDCVPTISQGIGSGK